MKHLLSFLVITLLAFHLSAQTVQHGIVQEYNEKAKKTPLPGVELNVRSAGSAVSAKDGSFSLEFLTLKPGERVNVRRIEKPGYEVFNREAVEQWNLNPSKPFVVVMCKSSKFKQIRDNYFRVSSESYARQMKKEEAALEKLKKDGRLKEEEYLRKRREIQENYERQLDNLDAYIDRFARIDLSELSSVEQEIIELVQQGRIYEAIQKYEDLHIEDALVEGLGQANKTKDAKIKLEKLHEDVLLSKDSLLASMSNQIEILLTEGSAQNKDKALSLYRQVADADPSNAEWQKRTADFILNEYGDKTTALHYYTQALQAARNTLAPDAPFILDLEQTISILTE